MNMNRESVIATVEYLLTMTLLGCINGLTMCIGKVMLIIAPVIILLMGMSIAHIIRVLWMNEHALE
jgi:hypothetical protein